MRSMAVAIHSAFSPCERVCIKSLTAAQAETGEVTKAERGYRLPATCIERARRLDERLSFRTRLPGSVTSGCHGRHQRGRAGGVKPSHAPANRARLPSGERVHNLRSIIYLM
jgi:hypothetical protein